MSKSDPERVESVKRLLAEAFPGKSVSAHDPGRGDAVRFKIGAGESTVTLRVSWERFQEDQTRTEEFVRQAISILRTGQSWLLTSDGTFVPE